MESELLPIDTLGDEHIPIPDAEAANCDYLVHPRPPLQEHESQYRCLSEEAFTKLKRLNSTDVVGEYGQVKVVVGTDSQGRRTLLVTDSWIKSGKGWRHSTTVVYRRYPTIAKRDALFHVEAGATFNQVLWNMIQLARAHYGTALPPADRRKKLILLAGTNDVKNFWYGKRLSTTHHHKPASDIISQLNAVKNALQHYYSPIFVVQVPETEINRPHCNIAIGYINESLRKFCVEGENARNNWHFINMPAFELGNVADHKDKFLHTDNVHIAPAMGDRLYIAMYRAIERVAQKRTAELQARKRAQREAAEKQRVAERVEREQKAADERAARAKKEKEEREAQEQRDADERARREKKAADDRAAEARKDADERAAKERKESEEKHKAAVRAHRAEKQRKERQTVAKNGSKLGTGLRNDRRKKKKVNEKKQQ